MSLAVLTDVQTIEFSQVQYQRVRLPHLQSVETEEVHRTREVHDAGHSTISRTRIVSELRPLNHGRLRPRLAHQRRLQMATG